MKARLICLVRRHQWHNGWDEDRHQTVWTCKRCGATRRSDEMGDPRLMDPGGSVGIRRQPLIHAGRPTRVGRHASMGMGEAPHISHGLLASARHGRDDPTGSR
jgi:hypothetical protein